MKEKKRRETNDHKNEENIRGNLTSLSNPFTTTIKHS